MAGRREEEITLVHQRCGYKGHPSHVVVKDGKEIVRCPKCGDHFRAMAAGTFGGYTVHIPDVRFFETKWGTFVGMPPFDTLKAARLETDQGDSYEKETLAHYGEDFSIPPEPPKKPAQTEIWLQVHLHGEEEPVRFSLGRMAEILGLDYKEAFHRIERAALQHLLAAHRQKPSGYRAVIGDALVELDQYGFPMRDK